jgi:hypothetical protein
MLLSITDPSFVCSQKCYIPSFRKITLGLPHWTWLNFGWTKENVATKIGPCPMCHLNHFLYLNFFIKNYWLMNWLRWHIHYYKRMLIKTCLKIRHYFSWYFRVLISHDSKWLSLRHHLRHHSILINVIRILRDQSVKKHLTMLRCQTHSFKSLKYQKHCYTLLMTLKHLTKC